MECSFTTTVFVFSRYNGDIIVCLFLCFRFEPSQPLGVTSGLNTNSNLSLTYSAHKSFNISHLSHKQTKEEDIRIEESAIFV